MRKMVLGKDNYKQIAALMQKMLNKPFVLHYGYDRKVTSVKLSEFASKPKGPDLFYGHERMAATVESFIIITHRINGPYVTVHVSPYRSETYYPGDVFYFYGGNMIKINKASNDNVVRTIRRIFNNERQISFDIYVYKKDVDPVDVLYTESAEKLMWESVIMDTKKTYKTSISPLIGGNKDA